MNEASSNIVQGLFRKYYEGIGSFGIRSVERRELAFSSFGKQGMIRHTSFRSMSELIEYVRKDTPLHFYYSSAYYESPESTMDNKKWKGADLVFDIDGDHIEGAEKMGYGEMLLLVKEELKKLLVLLVDDLSVNKRDLEVVFSGSRGYHVHVYSIFESLESQERREIVDYISGRCVTAEFRPTAKTRWNEKINAVKDSLLEMAANDRKWKASIEEETGEPLGGLTKRDLKGSDYIDRNARKIAVKKYSSRIDEPVTIDIHRLIRTPASLHGKSGLMVMTLSPDKVEEFDPLTEAIPPIFQDNSEVNVTKRIKLDFEGARHEVQEGYTLLPTYAALFAVLKGSAEFSPASR